MERQTGNTVKKVAGMDVAPEKFEWEHWLPLILRVLSVLAVAIAGWYGADTHLENAVGGLKATEHSVGEVVKSERGLRIETENLSETIEFYTKREVACDLALETFARHRNDERDFQMLVEQCHSEGKIE